MLKYWLLIKGHSPVQGAIAVLTQTGSLPIMFIAGNWVWLYSRLPNVHARAALHFVNGPKAFWDWWCVPEGCRGSVKNFRWRSNQKWEQVPVKLKYPPPPQKVAKTYLHLILSCFFEEHCPRMSFIYSSFDWYFLIFMVAALHNTYFIRLFIKKKELG